MSPMNSRTHRWLSLPLGFCFLLVGTLALSTAIAAEKKAAGQKAAAKKAPDSAKSAKKTDKKKKGFRFPSFKVKYFQVTKSKKPKLKDLSFSKLLGKKPVVLIYFMPGHKGSETELKAASAAAMLFKGKIEFLAITRVLTRKALAKAYKRVKELGVTMPVLLDDPRGMLAYVTLSRSVPNYAVVTRTGYLRVARASSLTELIRPNLRLLQVLQHAAVGKEIPFILAPGYSPNPYNVVGKKAPTFKAKVALGTGEETLQQHVKGKQPLLVVFWSVTCPHCRAVLPKLDKLAQKHKDKFRLVSLVQLDGKGLKKNLTKFVKDNKMTCKILADTKGKISDKYHVMMVPSMFLVNSKGEVVSTLLGAGKNLEQSLLAFLKKSKLTKTAKAPAKPSVVPAKAPAKPTSKPAKKG